MRRAPRSPGDPAEGELKVEWARAHMPILESIRLRFEEVAPFRGMTVSMALHVEAKTAALALAVRAGGAEVYLAASNPLTTDDDVVAYLQQEGLDTHAVRGESLAQYREGLEAMLRPRPQILIDDGADLVALAAARPASETEGLRGSTEETTTGVVRLRALEKDGRLRWPAINVNDALMKHLFDNRYGTGQSTLDGLFSATNLVLAGRTAVVAGYGWCGKGVAARLRGVGANVIVTEVNPARAVEARLEGFRVRRMLDAVREADFVITVTGCRDVVRAEHFKVMKDGCVLANAGHFDVEIDGKALAGMAVSHRKVRRDVEEFRLPDGRRIYLLAEGRLVNLASGQGHPVEIMDMSFSLQALSAEYLAQRGALLSPGVHPVPAELDERVARAALRAYDAEVDELTEEQEKYLHSWEVGT
jgi:adenosylhomocysteinase